VANFYSAEASQKTPETHGSDLMLDFDQIYHQDCIAGMASLVSDCIDLIVTDPPFAIDFKAKRGNYNRTASRVLEGYSEIPKADYAEFTIRWLEQAWRILKPSGSMYVFSGWNNLKDILVALDKIGFTTVNHIIWKYQFGVVTRRKFVSSHYHCLYVCKDDKQRRFYPFARFAQSERDSAGRSQHYRDKEDVWTIKREYWTGDHKTPTKLPRELIEKILSYSSQAGDVICDPFLGSGQVAYISRAMERHYIGFEINRDYYDFAKVRLDSGQYRLKVTDQGNLF